MLQLAIPHGRALIFVVSERFLAADLPPCGCTLKELCSRVGRIWNIGGGFNSARCEAVSVYLCRERTRFYALLRARAVLRAIDQARDDITL